MYKSQKLFLTQTHTHTNICHFCYCQLTVYLNQSFAFCWILLHCFLEGGIIINGNFGKKSFLYPCSLSVCYYEFKGWEEKKKNVNPRNEKSVFFFVVAWFWYYYYWLWSSPPHSQLYFLIRNSMILGNHRVEKKTNEKPDNNNSIIMVKKKLWHHHQLCAEKKEIRILFFVCGFFDQTENPIISLMMVCIIFHIQHRWYKDVQTIFAK